MNFFLNFTVIFFFININNSIIKRNDYLITRNNFIKKYISVKNLTLKKTYYYVSNKIDRIYNKYQDIYYYLIYKYYSLTEEEWILLDGISFIF